jgi:predicted nucleic acid-binding protein
MKMLLDSSVVSKLFIEEEDSDEVAEIIKLGIENDIMFISSELLHYEVGNVIWKREKQTESACELIKRVFDLNIQCYQLDQYSSSETMKLAKDNNITFYDAVLVELAKKQDAIMVTADEELLKKFKNVICVKDALKQMKKMG